MPAEAPQNEAPGQTAAPAPPAGRPSVGWSVWLLFVIALAALSYGVYTSGWLASLPSWPDWPSIPDLSSERSRADTVLQPAAGADAKMQAILSGYAVQLDALSSRITLLERAMRKQQRLSGQLAEDVARLPAATEGNGSPYRDPELALLRLDMIDLHLRLSGDSGRADAELGRLVAETSANELPDTQINRNRARLAALPPRDELLDKLANIAELAKEVARDAQKRINKQPVLFDNLLAGIMEVRKVTPQAGLDNIDAAQRAAHHAAAAASALALGSDETYSRHLAALRDAVNELSDTQTGLRTLAIAKLVAQLTTAGDPKYRLLLPPQTEPEQES